MNGEGKRHGPNTQFYGDRTGSVEDPFGHLWHVATHKEDFSKAEMKRRAEQAAKEAGG